MSPKKLAAHKVGARARGTSASRQGTEGKVAVPAPKGKPGANVSMSAEELKKDFMHKIRRIRLLGQLPSDTDDAATRTPIVDEAAQVLPDLFLGGMCHARNLEWIRQQRITGVLNLAGSEIPTPDPEWDWAGYPEGTAYLQLPAEDREGYPLLAEHFQAASDFLSKCFKERRKALVHCVQGMNRSATIVVAWLLSQERWPLPKAVHQICHLRKGALSNESFQGQLVDMASSHSLLKDDPSATAAVLQEEEHLRALFRMFLPDAAGFLGPGNFRSVLKSRPYGGVQSKRLDEAEIESHWEHLSWFVDEHVDLASFSTWLRADIQAHSLYPKLVCWMRDDSSVPSKISKQIWLGGVESAEDALFFKDAKISHVLNVSKDLPNTWEIKGSTALPVVKYFRIPIEDQIGEDILAKTEWLNCGLRWMEKALKSPKSCMFVHCGYGVSRSATFVAAFLMRSEKLTLDASIKRIQEVRPFAGPGAGFMEQLLTCERDWGFQRDGRPSVELWSYMEAPSPVAWQEQYATKREYFPWGVTCPSCLERCCDYKRTSCEQCRGNLEPVALPPV